MTQTSVKLVTLGLTSVCPVLQEQLEQAQQQSKKLMGQVTHIQPVSTRVRALLGRVPRKVPKYPTRACQTGILAGLPLLVHAYAPCALTFLHRSTLQVLLAPPKKHPKNTNQTAEEGSLRAQSPNTSDKPACDSLDSFKSSLV